MDWREYEHICEQPDTFSRCTLRNMRRALESVGSSAAPLIDKILQTGYLEPPADYKHHGCYRITLTDPTDDEVTHIITELERARDELETQVDSLSTKELQDELRGRRQYVRSWIRAAIREPIPWQDAKTQQTYFDIRQADLRQFESFIFDHDTPERREDGKWYFGSLIWIDYEEEKNAELFMELFKESRNLLKKYSKDQLEQGFWAMVPLGGLEGGVYELIWDSKLCVHTKERLIESMFDLYANLFSSDPLDNACMMWWDSLAYDFNPMKEADPEGNEEHRRIRDAMFRTLTRILQLESPACQRAALHGLNHVLHPDTESAINEYLSKHPELAKEDREYALICSRGGAI